jgi:polyisoprenoid-binding protein YceI
LTGRPASAPTVAFSRWQIDPGHTELAFIGRHFMLTKVCGRFTGVSGTIQVGEEPGDSTAEITIEMASVDSGRQARDEHLRSADFFDTARHPEATFTRVTVTDEEWRAGMVSHGVPEPQADMFLGLATLEERDR